MPVLSNNIQRNTKKWSYYLLSLFHIGSVQLLYTAAALQLVNISVAEHSHYVLIFFFLFKHFLTLIKFIENRSNVFSTKYQNIFNIIFN